MAHAGASAVSGLPHSGPKMHFIPCQQSQWGLRASAETLPNGSGMWSWNGSMCWRRWQAPLSLPPTRFCGSAGAGPLPSASPCSDSLLPKIGCRNFLSITGPAPSLLGSVVGSSLHQCTPFRGGPKPAAPGGDAQTCYLLLWCEGGC